MGYLIVALVSLLVGGWVYIATLRAGRERPVAVGFDGGEGDGAGGDERVDGPGQGYAYLRVATRRLSWRDRLQGFVGLMILLFIGAAALAFGIYQLGHLVNLTISRFLEN